MTILLDTNVVSELRKVAIGTADANVARWQSAIDSSDAYVSTITVLELELGVLLMERRDRRQGARLRAWMTDRVLPEFSDRILPIDLAVATRCARLHVPDPRPERDALIAATALVHRMALATRNIRDFEGMGVALVDPWHSDT